MGCWGGFGAGETQGHCPWPYLATVGRGEQPLAAVPAVMETSGGREHMAGGDSALVRGSAQGGASGAARATSQRLCRAAVPAARREAARESRSIITVA